MMRTRRIAAIGLAVVLLVWRAAGLAAEPGGPAREENFDGRTVKPQWEQVLGDGATITVKDGWATFEAPVGADCHVQQKPPGDNITVSAHLARWAGIYLVWDQDNWCGVGKISPTPFGRFYSIAVIGGKPVEVDHRGIDFNGRHDVRVRLGPIMSRFNISSTAGGPSCGPSSAPVRSKAPPAWLRRGSRTPTRTSRSQNRRPHSSTGARSAAARSMICTSSPRRRQILC